MSSEQKNQQNDRDKAEEPEEVYGEKKITFFDSVEEMNEHTYRQYANMSPEERLHAVCRMREAVWTEKPTKPFGCRIHIKK